MVINGIDIGKWWTETWGTYSAWIAVGGFVVLLILMAMSSAEDNKKGTIGRSNLLGFLVSFLAGCLLTYGIMSGWFKAGGSAGTPTAQAQTKTVAGPKLGDMKTMVKIEGGQISLTDTADSLAPGWRISWTADKKVAQLITKVPMPVPDGPIFGYFDPSDELRAKGAEAQPYVKLR